LSSRIYEWDIQGVTIISGQGNEEIEIIWNQEGITGTVGYTAFSKDNSSCAGTALPIEVKVATKLTLVTQLPIINVGCFGEATGKISMSPGGGTPPYTYEWSHNAALKTAVASNLRAGLYSVKVTDALGCTQTLTDIEVKEPPLLAIASLTTTATTCFGKKDGKVSLRVSGGVAPYSLEFEGRQVFTELFELNTLKKDK
jgi:hypothetical protein